MLDIKELKVKVGKKAILQGVSLKVNEGEVVAVMGPNGSGKSTLAYSLAGHPSYELVGGKIELDGERVDKDEVNERAVKGLFLGFQYPVGVSGVEAVNFLRIALERVRGVKLAPFKFREMIEKLSRDLKIDSKLLSRSINEGFSGGEKKKMEILQMAVLAPKYAILDETDSGLDIDALRIVADGVNKCRKDNPKMGVLLITHYQRILEYIKPDRVVVMKGGKIVKTGDSKLVLELEKDGYESI